MTKLRGPAEHPPRRFAQATFLTINPGLAGPDSGAGSVDKVNGEARGIQLAAGPASPPVVYNLIFRGVAGTCAWSDAANAPDALTIAAALVATCTAGDAVNAGITVVSRLDPEFVNPAVDDLHLAPTSPAVDSGDPTADCSLEPAPNGCRSNLGRWGNTAEAGARPGAPNCATCP